MTELVELLLELSVSKSVGRHVLPHNRRDQIDPEADAGTEDADGDESDEADDGDGCHQFTKVLHFVSLKKIRYGRSRCKIEGVQSTTNTFNGHA